MIKKVPLPISGLILGLSALTSLIKPYSNKLSLLFLSFAIFFTTLLVRKIFYIRKSFWKELKNPVTLSVLSTFPMALNIITVNLKPLLSGYANMIWYILLSIHIVIILYFTKIFIKNFEPNKIFASYFIVYVGIASYGATAKSIGNIAIGKIILSLAFIFATILLFLISYAYNKKTIIKPDLEPIICIYSAPFSLISVAYFNIFNSYNIYILYILSVLSITLYIYVLLKLPYLLSLSFYPSYSAFTFPIVISAIAFNKLALYNNLFFPLKYFSLTLAVLLCIYVTWKYTFFIFSKNNI